MVGVHRSVYSQTEYDPDFGVYRFENGNVLGFNKQRYVCGSIFTPSETGTAGPGVYFGNTPESVGAYGIGGSHETAVLSIPFDPASVAVVRSHESLLKKAIRAAGIDRQSSIDTVIDELVDGASLVLGKPCVALKIGNLIAGCRNVQQHGAHVIGVYRGDLPVEIVEKL